MEDNKNSTNVISYLSQFKEEMPEWLCNYRQENKVPFSDIMSSRVGYYPGSGFDGTLFKVCNRSHSVHSYLYVDFHIRKDEMKNHLLEPRSIYGYHSIGRIEWDEKDLMPNGQYPIDVTYNRPNPYNFVLKDEPPYCFTEIMERDEDRTDDWGAKRFAVTFLFADGTAAYYQLFCKEYQKAPWIFLLKDHGFGGNPDRFGKGGVLDKIISLNGTRPEYVLCRNNDDIWKGYELIKGLEPVIADTDQSPLLLWQKN